MRLLLPNLLAASLAAWAGPALAADGCRAAALAALQAAAPDGFAIYRQTGRPDFFRSWIDCGASQYDLPTAVHEATHFIASETDAFPLVGGGAVARPHRVSGFFPPSKIADRFEADDFTTIYLHEGKASSATDFLYLLDEFNAYSHDLEAAVDLAHLSAADLAVDHRDGLAAMMAFVVEYAETARASEPATWGGLQQPDVAGTLSTLWVRAEGVMARSCGIPRFGTLDRSYLGRVCAAGERSALAQILGRAPACPGACLTAAPDLVGTGDEVTPAPSAYVTRSVETQSEETRTDDGAAPDLPRHPFAAQAGPRRHRLRAAAR